MKNDIRRRSGFTLIEIMVVMVLIAVVAAVAIPNFVKARGVSSKSACVNNLRQIAGAKEQWALENKKTAGSAVVISEVNAYIKGGAPTCPAAGTYTYYELDRVPTCSISGPNHSL